MNEVFINYRTGDGDQAAVVLDTELSHRFGKDAVFRAAKSLSPGERFADGLVRGVRRCWVLLAVMGAGWAADARLHDPGDWVRRELLEAHGNGVVVIPVLVGRETLRLKRSDLPEPLQWLVEIHSLRLDLRDNGSDLQRIGDEITERVPAFRQAGAQKPEQTEGRNHTTQQSGGTAFQMGSFTGPIGNVIQGNQTGPIHTGSGSIHQVPPPAREEER